MIDSDIYRSMLIGLDSSGILSCKEIEPELLVDRTLEYRLLEKQGRNKIQHV